MARLVTNRNEQKRDWMQYIIQDEIQKPLFLDDDTIDNMVQSEIEHQNHQMENFRRYNDTIQRLKDRIVEIEGMKAKTLQWKERRNEWNNISKTLSHNDPKSITTMESILSVKPPLTLTSSSSTLLSRTGVEMLSSTDRIMKKGETPSSKESLASSQLITSQDPRIDVLDSMQRSVAKRRKEYMRTLRNSKSTPILSPHSIKQTNTYQPFTSTQSAVSSVNTPIASIFTAAQKPLKSNKITSVEYR
eukprot:g1164.t1